MSPLRLNRCNVTYGNSTIGRLRGSGWELLGTLLKTPHNYVGTNVTSNFIFQFGVLAAAYRRYFGEQWFDNSSFINELGYLLCGFPAIDLEKISPSTFKELSLETLSKTGKCNSNQTRVSSCHKFTRKKLYWHTLLTLLRT